MARAIVASLGPIMLLAATTLVLASVPSCSTDPVGTDSAFVREVAGGLGVTRITTAQHYVALAAADGGLLTPGKTVKFLIDNRGEPTMPIVYQNAKFTNADGSTPDAARYHFYFGERVLPDFAETVTSFNDATYETLDKRYYAGTIQTYYLGDSEEPLYGVQFYPEDAIREEVLLKAIQLVAASVDVAPLAFVATGAHQTTDTIQNELAALGVADLTLDEVLGSIRYIPLNAGEAWGYLRVFPDEPDLLSAIDIPVFDELPLDLSVVAGTITKAYRDPTSHVNLKSKERGTPNMVLRDATRDHELLRELADKPVHLTVAAEGFTIELSSDAEVRAKLQERLDKPWVTLPYDATDRLLSYGDMCPRQAARCLSLSEKYGSKASNLGFMTSPEVLGRTSNWASLSAKFGYDIAPHGFGVPLKFYKDFVAYPPNQILRAKLDELVRREKLGDLSPLARRTMVAEVHAAFYAAAFPPGMIDGIKARLEQALPGINKLKVRSSANAEDMPNFDGAGLYSSFSATVSKSDNADGSCEVVQDGVKLKMSPKTVACAIKGVYASTWNKRAVEERSYARLDHASALMGIAIVPKYSLESPIAANSVVITRVVNTNNVYGYTFSSQQGNGLVTNPNPGTLAESTIAAFTAPREDATFVVTRFAKPTAGEPQLSQTVMSEATMQQMLAITRRVETQYCRARPGYYGGDCNSVSIDPNKPRSLDFELKYLENGHFICKQVREFSGQ